MLPPSFYHPVWFYSGTLVLSFLFGGMAARVSHQRIKKRALLFCLVDMMCVPCGMALALVYGTHSEVLIEDFVRRLLLVPIDPILLLVLFLLMPCVVLVATTLSLCFGYSKDQFLLSNKLSVMKGRAFFGVLIPLLVAPLVEELGWRGYGIDSLRASYNLATSSVVFGVIWAIWHLPLFYIKGYYHRTLIDLGFIYVLNFFVSVVALAFLSNWIYYKMDRSIPSIIFFHAVANGSFMFLRTAPFTKCLVTLLLVIISTVLLFLEPDFFFVM